MAISVVRDVKFYQLLLKKENTGYWNCKWWEATIVRGVELNLGRPMTNPVTAQSEI